MNNKKIPTTLGLAILLIIAATVFGVVWKYKEAQKIESIQNQNVVTRPKVESNDQEQKNKLNNQELLEAVTDWNEYISTDNSFSLKYPTSWKMEGSSIFIDEAGNKIAEFLPGVIELQPNQKCLDYLKDDSLRIKIISRKNIVINRQNVVLVVSEVAKDPGGGTWFPNTYCVYKGDKAFVMAFYNHKLNSSSQKLYDEVISTFKFEK